MGSEFQLEGLTKGDVLIGVHSGRLLTVVFVKYGKGRIHAVPITKVKYIKRTYGSSQYSYPVKQHEVELNSKVLDQYNDYLQRFPTHTKHALGSICISFLNSIGILRELDVSCLSAEEKDIYDQIMTVI